MKKKILSLIFAIFMIVPCCFALTACGGGEKQSKDALFLDGGSWSQLNESLIEGEIVDGLPGWQKLLVQNGYNLSIIKELGFYLESEVPKDLNFNENLTTAYDSLLGNKKKKNLVKVYTSIDDTKIGFASEQKIQAPQNSEMLFANIWKYAVDAKSDCYVDLEVLNLSNFYTDNVTNMCAMFFDCYSLKTLNLKTFNTSNVTNMSMMFVYCWDLTELDLSNFSLENVTNSYLMLDLSNESEISELLLPLNWGNVSSLEICAKYDLFDEVSGEQLTVGREKSEVSENYAGRTLIAGDPITFYIDGVKDESLTPNRYINKRGLTLPTPNKDNYDFSGWFDNDDYEGTPIEEILIGETGPKTYYGRTTPCSYWITYMVNGSEYSSSSYTYGVGTTLINLERDGYTFSGWYENEDLTGSKVTAISKTDSGIKTFYATLTGETYWIKYYVNGTLQSCTPSSYTCGKGATLPDLTQNHYIFSGWYEDASCKGSIVTQISNEEFGNKTYYATNTPETYNIRYFVDGNEVTTLSPSTYEFGTSITLPEQNKKGYIFSGWFTDSTYTSEKVVSLSEIDAGNKVFYGYFEKETYTISYFVDGKGETLNPATYYYGDSIILPQPTKDGYKFSGWYENEDYTGLVVTTISETEIGNKQFYGKFTLEPVELPSNWKMEIANSMSLTYIKEIAFCSEAPTDYTKVSTLSTGIEVYSNTDSGVKIALVWPQTIYAPVDSSYLFGSEDDSDYKLSSLGSISFENFNTSKVTNMSHMFASLIFSKITFDDNFDTSNVTDMSGMFYMCYNLTELDLSNFDTSKVENMESMFQACPSLTSLNLSGFNTSNVTNMSNMFYMFNQTAKSSVLTTLDLSSFDTSKVTNMSGMFYYCKALTSLNLSSFNTSNVTDMSKMFDYCLKLTSLNLSSFDTSNVTDMSCMFYYCNALTSLNLSSFNTSAVIKMTEMFYSCSALTSLDLSSFNTSKVESMNRMFAYCSALTSLDLRNFDTTNVTNGRAMFKNTFSDNPSGSTLTINDKFIYTEMSKLSSEANLDTSVNLVVEKNV